MSEILNPFVFDLRAKTESDLK
ncbi:MAG: hypothetical protein RLY83_571, partial [Actinomycetota bacterium]